VVIINSQITSNINTVSESKPTVKNSDRSFKRAAQAFEAHFIEKMLNSVEQSSFGDEASHSNTIFNEMRNRAFAEEISKNGGFGIASNLEKSLKK